MKLWMKILLALILGVIVGLIIGPNAVVLKPLGTIFLSLINMVIMLLVLVSTTMGIASINDPKKLGRIGLQTLFLFFLATLFSVSLGLGFGYLFQPGQALNLVPAVAADAEPNVAISIKDILLGIIPSNPFASLAEGNILQVIVFALFLGISITLIGEKGKPLLNVLESLSEVIFKMVGMIMEFSPVGIFAIMAWVSGTFGVAVFLPLAKFLGSFYLAVGVHVLIVICGILFLAKVNPLPFFRGMSDAIMFAFTTCSSSATIPTTMKCLENMGVAKNISGFVLPVGITLNLNGSAIFQSMSAVFIAQAYGITLEAHQYILIAATAALSSVATAGIPGTGFIMLSAVVSAAGLPLEGLALIAGIDRLRDMGGTALNVAVDAVIAVFVAKKEGEFEESKYYALGKGVGKESQAVEEPLKNVLVKQ